jgi:hypothetical protein
VVQARRRTGSRVQIGDLVRCGRRRRRRRRRHESNHSLTEAHDRVRPVESLWRCRRASRSPGRRRVTRVSGPVAGVTDRGCHTAVRTGVSCMARSRAIR